MAKSGTPETIAEEVRAAVADGTFDGWLNALAGYTEEMNMVHEPATPHDGPIAHDAIYAMNAGAAESFTKVFPDGFTISGPVTVNDNVIVTALTISGTVADGSSVSYTSNTEWTVEDGHVVACFAKAEKGADETEARENIQKAFAAAGIEPGVSDD